MIVAGSARVGCDNMCYQYNEEVKKDTKKAEVESSADKQKNFYRDWLMTCFESKKTYRECLRELEKVFNHKETKVVYISSPFSAEHDWEVRDNVEQAMRVAIRLMSMGYVPIYTHGNYYLDKIAQSEGINFSYETWIENCVELLSRCDAMLYLGYSRGCNAELDYAIRNNIPVYFSVNDLAKPQKEMVNDCTITF